MFYGRENEIKKLCAMFRADGQRISLIYGRRRIGKSELIKQVLKETDCKSIYYECKQTTEQNNTESLAELTGRHLISPSLHLKTWRLCYDFYSKNQKKNR